MWPFVQGTIDAAAFKAIVSDAYAVPAVFADEAVTPLVPLGAGSYLLELFHGPTLAFKDVALQLVGRLFDHELKARAISASRSSARHRATPGPRRSKPAATARRSTS